MSDHLFNDPLQWNNEEIDPLLRDVIEKINAKGIVTDASCQGRTCEADFVNRKHCTHSYLTFTESLWKMRKRIRQAGLILSNGSISLTIVTGDESTMEEIIAKNLAFPVKLKELFDLPD